MTQPTFEEKNKIKEIGWLSQATLKMILQIIHEFKATVHQTHVERITNSQRKKSSEKKRKKNNNNNNKLIQKQSEFALQKVILWTSCYGLSPLDTKSLNTNVNKNERYHFQRHYKSGQLVA